MTKFYKNCHYFATTVPLSQTATARSRIFFTASGSSYKVRLRPAPQHCWSGKLIWIRIRNKFLAPWFKVFGSGIWEWATCLVGRSSNTGCQLQQRFVEEKSSRHLCWLLPKFPCRAKPFPTCSARPRPPWRGFCWSSGSRDLAGSTYRWDQWDLRAVLWIRIRLDPEFFPWIRVRNYLFRIRIQK